MKPAPWTRVTPPRPHVDGQFRQPTDVTWDTQGNIFISDGYINSRVAKYDKNGDWVKSWGEKGSKPGEFNTPHSIAADARGNIYVADRGNRRIQVFDPDGKFLREMKSPTCRCPPTRGRRSAIRPDGGHRGDASSPARRGRSASRPDRTRCCTRPTAFPGRIYKLTLDGKVLGVLGKAGKQPKQFGWIHEIACPSENELYVAEILNWRVQKLTLHPDTRQTASR